MTVLRFPEPLEQRMRGFDILQRAYSHLRHQFSVTMPREKAIADFEARKLLICLMDQMIGEVEKGIKR